jgi:hypothetical protein
MRLLVPSVHGIDRFAELRTACPVNATRIDPNPFNHFLSSLFACTDDLETADRTSQLLLSHVKSRPELVGILILIKTLHHLKRDFYIFPSMRQDCIWRRLHKSAQDEPARVNQPHRAGF